MKLFKLSLAAVVAAGALSSVSAAPLEEAIKDIDVSGFGRYRFQSDHWKNDQATGDFSRSIAYRPTTAGTNRSSDAFHRFTLDVNFKATLDDNFFAVIGLRYDSRDTSGRGVTAAESGISHVNSTGSRINGGWANGDSFSVRQYYVGFTAIPYTTVLFGRQPAGTFFTDDIVATGLKVAVSPVEGLTIAAVAFDDLENDGDLADFSDVTGGKRLGLSSSYPYPARIVGVNGLNYAPYQNNLYGAAVIYNNEIFSAQAWLAHLQNVGTLWALDAGVNYAFNDDVAIRGQAQVAGSHLKNKFKNRLSGIDETTGINLGTLVHNSTFFGVDLGASLYGFDVDAGYITYGKKGYIGIHSLEDKGSFIKAGEELLDYTRFSGKHKVWFAKAKYTFDAFSVGLDYVHDKVKGGINSTDNGLVQGADMKNHEWVFRAGYKYSEKLSFSAWYSLVNEKYQNVAVNQFGQIESIKNKHSRFRFDARYNF